MPNELHSQSVNNLIGKKRSNEQCRSKIRKRIAKNPSSVAELPNIPVNNKSTSKSHFELISTPNIKSYSSKRKFQKDSQSTPVYTNKNNQKNIISEFSSFTENSQHNGTNARKTHTYKSHNEYTENFIQESWELINASKKQHVEKVKQILEDYQEKYQSNLWINERDQFGWAALHYAAFFGNLNICKTLILKGSADINIQTSRGQETPLFLAAANNHHRLIDFFISQKADVNIPDYTGKIALEVSYNEGYEILSMERAKQNKIIRFIPTARKLLTNKFFQFLLQLLLCVFLEIFYDKLMSAANKTLHLFIVLQPQVRQFILNVFSRIYRPLIFLFAPIFEFLAPLFSVIFKPTITLFLSGIKSIWTISFHSLYRLIEFFISPFLWTFRSLLSPFISSSWKILTSLFQFFFQNSMKYFLYPLLKFASSFVEIFWIIFKSFFHFIWLYLYLMIKYFFTLFITILSNAPFVQTLMKFLLVIKHNSFSIIWKSLQPNQLAAKLVFPIILGAAKLLHLLPREWVDGIVKNYTKIVGKDRHVSNEEIAAVSLLIMGIGIYIFGIIGGGYFLRIVFLILNYLNEFHVLEVFIPEIEVEISWKIDSSLHELGLIFLLCAIPIIIIYRFIFKRFFWNTRRILSSIKTNSLLGSSRSNHSLPALHSTLIVI